MVRLIIRSHESENILIRYELVKDNTKNKKQQLLVFYFALKAAERSRKRGRNKE